MLTKVHGKNAFQVLTSAFSISPSDSGYQLEISADGTHYSPLFTVGAGVTRLVTGVAANSYYRLAGNTSDVVVNWQKSCGGDGGGSGTGATITVDTALSSSSTNPVENRVITNALNNIPGAEVDDELTSGSTNAVQSKAIYDVLNGVTSSTQMEISSVDSTIQLRYRFYGSTASSTYMYANFKEANIDGYYVIDLGGLPVGEAENINQLLLSNIIINGTYYGFEDYSPNTSNLGQKVLVYPDGGSIWVFTANLGNTYDYYLVLNANENYVFLSATLPVLTEVTDHKANLSDLPTAQDGSDFKQYVYNGDNTKQVVSRVGVSPGYSWGQSGNKKKGEIENIITSSVYPWNSNACASSTARINIGSEYVPGMKSIRDSVIIDKADQALYGFTEQITLTPTSASTDYINNYGTQYYFSETNDPRYLVYYFDGNSYLNAPEVYLSGVKYAIKNAPSTYNGNMPLTGIYQLAEVGNQYYGYSIQFPSGSNPCYIIIDKELLTLEVADSLTITRAKQIKDAFVTPLDLTGGTETIVHTETTEIVSESNNIFAHLYRNGSSNTISAYLSGTTNASIYVLLLDDETYFGKPYQFFIDYININGTSYQPHNAITAAEGATASILTTGAQEITVPENFDGYLILDTSNMTVSCSNNLPSRTWTETVTIPGVLDDYMTSGETHTAIQEALYGAIITGATTPVDTQLDSASTWPVENRVITNKFNDYYTKQETDALIQDMATEQYVDAAVANLATTGDVANAVSGLASESYVDDAVGEVVQGLGMLGVVNDVALSGNTVTVKKTSASGSQMVTGSTQFDVVVPADITNMVESTAVKHIVKCTQAQYDAIAIPDEDTLYIITGVNP